MAIYQKFKEAQEKYPENEALAYLKDGEYRAMSYTELSKKVKQLASGFAQNGLEKSDKVAFMVSNSPDLAMIDLACACLGIIDVPIHTTYGSEYIKYIVEHTECKWLIIEQEFWKAFKKDLHDLQVEKVVVVGEGDDYKNLFIDADDFSSKDPHPSPLPSTGEGI